MQGWAWQEDTAGTVGRRVPSLVHCAVGTITTGAAFFLRYRGT